MNKIKQMRAALTGITNTGGVEPSYGAVEVNARIEKKIEDASPKFSELRNMIPRESHDQFSVIWNVRTSDNTSTVWGYSGTEGGSNTNTPATGAKKQLVAAIKTVRTDWEVENFMKEASATYYNSVQDEIMNALEIHIDQEEKQIVGGDDASAYGDASGYLGMKQIINSYVTIGDTDTVFGHTRGSTTPYLDAGVVNASGSALALTHLDSAITTQRRAKGTPGFFVMSYEKTDEVNQLLQAQQRFSGTLDLEGGFTVSTYKRIPLIGSRYMDKAGSADTDTRIYLTHANNFVMRVLRETANEDVNLGRLDATGGRLKTYEVLQCKDLTKNVVIEELAA